MRSIESLFPRASKSFIEANPQSSPPNEPQKPVQGSLVRPRRVRMNRTEAEYALILEAQKQKGEILRYEFEGITLRFQGVKYTPDFVVLWSTLGTWWKDGEKRTGPLEIKFIEIKGGYIKGHFERAIERFRHARTYYPEFQFEMWQKSKDGWKQIL